MKKIKIVIVAIVIAILSLSLAKAKDNRKTLYISQVVNHPALDITRQGIIDELEKQGFYAGKNLNYEFATSQGDIVISNQIAKKFISKQPDCIIAIGTTVAQSLANANKEAKIPLIYSSVTDPSSASLVNNITGVSNFIGLSKQLTFYKEMMPSLTKLGFIYNPGEVNSVQILNLLKKESNNFNIEITSTVANKTSDIAMATAQLVGRVDAIFISNDNTALSAFNLIAKICQQSKIPLFVSDTDLVEQGALASIGPNQYDIGIQTGKMAARILNGTNISDIKPELPKDLKIVINNKLAKKIGFTIPDQIIAKADESIN
jgi:putative ABC transport system substrate-binding protein